MTSKQLLSVINNFKTLQLHVAGTIVKMVCYGIKNTFVWQANLQYKIIKNLPTNVLTLVDMNTLVILILYCYSKWNSIQKTMDIIVLHETLPHPDPLPQGARGFPSIDFVVSSVERWEGLREGDIFNSV